MQRSLEPIALKKTIQEDPENCLLQDRSRTSLLAFAKMPSTSATQLSKNKPAFQPPHASLLLADPPGPAILSHRAVIKTETRAPKHQTLGVHPAPVNGAANHFFFEPLARRQWRRAGSNRQPPACKAGALPIELRPPLPCGSGTANCGFRANPHFMHPKSATTRWAYMDSNHGPRRYQRRALTN